MLNTPMDAAQIARTIERCAGNAIADKRARSTPADIYNVFVAELIGSISCWDEASQNPLCRRLFESSPDARRITAALERLQHETRKTEQA